MSHDYNITVPDKDRTFFRQWAKKMGWPVTVHRKKASSYELAREDVKAGRVSGPYDSADAMFEAVLGHTLCMNANERTPDFVPETPGTTPDKLPDGQANDPYCPGQFN